MTRRLLLSATLLLSACQGVVNVGSSDEASAKTDERELNGFERIAASGWFDVQAHAGKDYRVEVEAAPEILDKIKTEVRADTLHIDMRSGFSFNPGQATVRVWAPRLSAVKLDGSGNIRVKNIDSDAFSASVSGSGDIEADGNAQSLSVQIAGSGDVTTTLLKSEMASVSIAGSGDARIHAAGRVTGSISGSGDVSVSGGAKCSVTVAGSGNVHC